MRERIPEPIYRHRYDLTVIFACLVSLIPFSIGVNSGHTLIGFFLAACIYIPVGLAVQHRQNRRHERDKDIIANAIR